MRVTVIVALPQPSLTENEDELNWIAGAVTTKLPAEVAIPDGVTTVMGPVEAPTGTVATISVVEFTVKEALTPLKFTEVGEIKLVPLIVTTVPTGPLPGVNPLSTGTELADPVIVKPREMLKKMFPAASTLTRALPLGVPGIVTVSAPSFGVLLARMIGKVFPPSVDRVILTLAQLTGELLVFATFQLTV